MLASEYPGSCDYIYKHIDPNNQNDILELKKKIFVLENCIQFLTAQINELEETNIENNHPQEQTEIIFEWSQCDYTDSTSAVLKRHVTMKHKSLEPKQKDILLWVWLEVHRYFWFKTTYGSKA